MKRTLALAAFLLAPTLAAPAAPAAPAVAEEKPVTVGYYYRVRWGFQKEEQRRFEILDAHWDVPLTGVEPPR